MDELQEKIEALELFKKQLLKEDPQRLKRLKKIGEARVFCHYLDANGIYYDVCIKHKEVLGCEQSSKYYQRFQDYLPHNYVICKNLLVKERKGEKKKFLVITDSRKQLDLTALKEELDCKKLEFVGEEEMKRLIHTTPGNVSVFNMIKDKEKEVSLIMDQDLLDQESLAFHPMYNGMSIFLSPKECLKFLKFIQREVRFVPMKSKNNKGIEKKLAIS